MKVFAKNKGKVYVQKGDLVFFLKGTEKIPLHSTILDVIIDDNFKVTDENRHDFVEFTSPIDVAFFKNCDWIVDYHDFDNMTEEEIENCRHKMIEERNGLAKSYNGLSAEEGRKQLSQVFNKIELLEYKIFSIKEIIMHKKGYLKFPLPNEKENALQKVFKRLKKHE